MIIPPEKIDVDSLRGIAESFVLREGTDYGEQEQAFEDKVEQVLKQITNKQVLILFDSETESINLINADDYLPPD